MNRIFKNLTQRIELSSQKKWTSFQEKWLKELNLFEDFLTPRIKNFLWLGRWNFFSIWIKDLCLFFQQIHSKMVQLLLQHDNFFQKKFRLWTFVNMTHRIEPFLKNLTQGLNLFFSMTQRIVSVLSILLAELNPLFEHVSMNRTLF